MKTVTVTAVVTPAPVEQNAHKAYERAVVLGIEELLDRGYTAFGEVIHEEFTYRSYDITYYSEMPERTSDEGLHLDMGSAAYERIFIPADQMKKAWSTLL